ncbi:hypothetical protein R3W88_003390 [Solanum pinnatisectum]|uniref:Uncharacterized protein n=1 Tax=Solanum pinnatisectum TaxID=50273 RepID=A0AAV9MPK6_9SOLN|nr:hypothetical protein R3W88_003390 [Solanum pinnatisectum]
MELRVCIKLKKGLENFKDYPLCITWKAIDIHHTLSINGEQCGEVNTEIIAHGTTNTDNLNVIEYNDMAAREIAYFQQCNIIESDVVNVPSDDQLYKDKKILKSIIENYPIRRKF